MTRIVPEVDPNPASVLLEHTAAIVTAYVCHNNVPPAELPNLIGQVHQSLTGIAKTANETAPLLVPAVPPRKSVTADYIICLEDGKPFKSLKRHLRTSYNLTPEEYREKWGLDPSYPMVAPAYSKIRSNLAKASQLGYRRTR